MSDTPSPTSALTYRQKGPQVTAWLFIAAAALMLVDVVRTWSVQPEPLLGAGLLLGIAVGWVTFLRPAVVLDQTGVLLRNPLRDVKIPWAALTDVESRWNVRVFAGDRGYTAWAISSQVQRPPGGSMFSLIIPNKLTEYAREMSGGADEAPETKVTARLVADVIEETRLEYDAAVAAGDITPPAEPAVAVRWVPPTMAALFVPLLAVVWLTLV